MSKDLYNNSAFLGKSLYNLQPAGRVTESALSNFMNNFIGNNDIQNDGSAGNNVFGVVAADIVNSNVIYALQDFSVGTGNLLRIIPLDLQRINDAFTYGVMITTNLYSSQSNLANGYTSIKLDVPYVYNIADHVLDVMNKEAPDNFLEVSNSKFRVTGPFTNIKSTKTSFKAPNITLGYYDREESGFEAATTLNLKTYDKGIVMERVEVNNATVDDIKMSYMGYSQEFGRFVMYKDAVYSGTEQYRYPKMDGSPSDDIGVLSEYQIDRNPLTLGLNEGSSSLEVDNIYTNNIIASDHTGNRSLKLYSYDQMEINVERAVGDTDLNRTFDLLLNVEGRIIMNSLGEEGTTQSSDNDYRIQSLTGTFINAYNPDNLSYMGVPVYIGYNSMVDINNWLRTTYISTGVTNRNTDTMVEIGGNFESYAGLTAGSKLLISGSITGESNNNIHGTYSKPTINVPTNSTVNNISNITLDPLTLNLLTGSSVETSSTLHIVGATTTANNNYALLVSDGEVRFTQNDAYLNWANGSLNLENTSLNITSNNDDFPIISYGDDISKNNIYTVKRNNVDGTNELFIDGIGARILLNDDTTYYVTGRITASQGSNIAAFEIKYCLTINNSIKLQKYYLMNETYCDISTTGENLFDVIVSYSGDDTNFVIGDGLTITCSNINNIVTNWFGQIDVITVSKP